MIDRNPKTTLAELAAQALRAEASALDRPSFDHRTNQIGAIEHALRGRARRRRIVRNALAVALVAAPAAAALIVRISVPSFTRNSAGPPAASAVPLSSPVLARAVVSLEDVDGWVEVNGVERDLRRGDEIAAGMGVAVSRQGRAVMRLSTGTRITLSGGGAARVSELGALTRFDLSRGTFGAEVVKLVPGERFLVVTPDAEIEVKGTRFEVAVASTSSPCGAPTQTSIDVRSGIVAVRFASHELRLTAGQHWPDCPSAESDPPRAAPVFERTQTHRHAAHARPTNVASTPSSPPSPDVASAPPSSTLSQQNDLLAAALAAERRGDLDEAERWLDQLMRRYPGGQLADSARAARRRLEALGAAKASDR